MTAALVALSGLPGMGPARLRAVLARCEPEEAWARVLRGEVDADGVPAHVCDRWRAAASTVDVDALWRAHRDAGVRVVREGDAEFPPMLADDPEPPVLLFVRGSLDALHDRRVAVVGTRRCTWSGRLVARSLGEELAGAGVCVVSGLALGIDGEAHAGALRAGGRPIAVVATGIDVVYPRRHAQLWAQVAAAGAVVSEYPLGTPPERWRFPARNRLIAALAEVVVVVESGASGGSLHTVDAALERDRPVLAVPGPVRSPASAGTNGLLAAGCPPCRDAADVLVALGLTAAAAPRASAASAPDDPEAARVLDALGWEPATLDELAERLDAPLGPVAVHLTRLANAGWVVQRSGWWERAR
ncbi:MAG: processing protein [Actinomycetota bacterium]|nr:processing protein [Actinomycetota bacterium]